MNTITKWLPLIVWWNLVILTAVIADLTPSNSEETPQTLIIEPETVSPEPTMEPVEESRPWTDEEVTVLAKMVWGEARGVPSDTEKAAVVWCVLNRVDQGYGSIITVVTTPNQFIGYRKNNQLDDELITLCIDVLTRWYAEKDGQVDVGRVLPKDYLWFSGDGSRNHFRNAYRGGDRWDWSLPSPYES